MICSLQIAFFLSDCQPLISYFHNLSGGLPNWRIRHAVEDINDILDKTQSDVKYIPRAQNVIADYLARNAHDIDQGVVSFRCTNYGHNEGCPIKRKICNLPSWASLCTVACI